MREPLVVWSLLCSPASLFELTEKPFGVFLESFRAALGQQVAHTMNAFSRSNMCAAGRPAGRLPIGRIGATLTSSLVRRSHHEMVEAIVCVCVCMRAPAAGRKAIQKQDKTRRYDKISDGPRLCARAHSLATASGFAASQRSAQLVARSSFANANDRNHLDGRLLAGAHYAVKWSLDNSLGGLQVSSRRFRLAGL